MLSAVTKSADILKDKKKNSKNTSQKVKRQNAHHFKMRNFKTLPSIQYTASL